MTSEGGQQEELILRYDPDDIMAFEVCLRQLVDHFTKEHVEVIPRFAWEQAFEGELSRMEDDELRDEVERWQD